ncbi:MAG TPA: ABC transporter permease subunit [Mycobacteriales bacterium]
MSAFAVYVAATVVLWATSAAMALVLAVLLAAGGRSPRRPVRIVAGSLTTLTRGVPTSLLVIAAGTFAMGTPPPGWLPNPFPGTPDGMVVVAWSIVAALAFGSAGHLGVILRSAYESLGEHWHEQVRTMGSSTRMTLALVVREVIPAGLPPVGARLVHHLHNTAFAALFPVADLFGWVQLQANTTFEVTHYAVVGALGYVVLSGAIWGACRLIEARVAGDRRVRRRPPAVAAVAVPR